VASGELRAALEQLERTLRQLGAPIAAAFRPGASDDSIRAAVRTRRWNLELYGETGGADRLLRTWLPVTTTDRGQAISASTRQRPGRRRSTCSTTRPWEKRTERLLASLAEFATLLKRVLDERVVVPDPIDARAWTVDVPTLPTDVRRLAMW
jgi:hypothetical protein